MQNGIIFFPDSSNIGDDIQTYAASLLVDNPKFCDRERLNEITEKTHLLCNGWFMENAENWPPSEEVKPLFISFHINSKNQEKMTSPDAIEYYKKYEPIGCRDYHTVNLLEKFGVKTYFSGCLTLTLPKYNGPKTEEILFVDVLRHNYTTNYRQTIIDNIIPEPYKNKVKFVSHLSSDLKRNDADFRMNQAKQMLDRYAKAKLVFTSLIHCALPCVAMGTPVIFVDFGFNNDQAKRDRFNGIIDLFHIESSLKAPFMERNMTSKIGRGLGLYYLSKNSITKLPEELFEYNHTTDKHEEMVAKIKSIIQNNFDS